MAFLPGYIASEDEMRLSSLLSCLQVLQSAPAEQFLWIITHVLTFSDTAVFEIFTLWPQLAPHSPVNSFHKLISLLTKMWPESSIWSVIVFLSKLHKRLFLSLQRKTHNSYSVFTRLSLLLYPSFISIVVKSIVLGISSLCSRPVDLNLRVMTPLGQHISNILHIKYTLWFTAVVKLKLESSNEITLRLGVTITKNSFKELKH